MKYLLLLLFFLPICLSSQSVIDKIEPPFWWQGMNNTELQLMVYGKDIQNLEPVFEKKSIKIKKVHKTDSPNYLFIDIEIPTDLQAGVYDLLFKKGKRTKANFQYEIKERVKASAQREGIDQSDVVYLITPDRFANGDPNNDEVDGLLEGYDRALEYGRHGGDLQGISDHLDYIKDVGFSTIWLNPVLINDQDEWSYHGYATTDYYQVDPRFGTNEEYVQLALDAKEKGMGMIMDIIVNHCGSFHHWMKDPPFDDWINNQDGAYQQTNHRKETLLDPYKSESDRKVMTEGWFVPAMPDLNQRNPFMSTYLIQNSIWWIEYAHLAGIRQDTYSYPFRKFMTDWTCAIQAEYPNFYIVGEEWIDDPSVIAYWQEGKVNQDGYSSCLPGLMDFPLCFAIHKAFTEEEAWDKGLIKLYQSLSKDFHYADPAQLIIFPDNHDMKRIFVEMQEDLDKYKQAMAFLMTTRGIPQLYYGTEIAMNAGANGSHGLIRADFPGCWAGDSTNIKDGLALDDLQQEALSFCTELINWRNSNEAIHKGKLIHFIPENGVYVYFRTLENSAVMVILNKNEDAYTLDLDRFREILDGYETHSSYKSTSMQKLGDSLDLDKNFMILELKK